MFHYRLKKRFKSATARPRTRPAPETASDRCCSTRKATRLSTPTRKTRRSIPRRCTPSSCTNRSGRRERSSRGRPLRSIQLMADARFPGATSCMNISLTACRRWEELPGVRVTSEATGTAAFNSHLWKVKASSSATSNFHRWWAQTNSIKQTKQSLKCHNRCFTTRLIQKHSPSRRRAKWKSPALRQ